MRPSNNLATPRIRKETLMLFARTYPALEIHAGFDYGALRQMIEENMRRGYSWWFGEYDPNLPCEPGYIPNVRERMEKFAATLPERTEKLPARNDFTFPVKPFPGNQRLPGLCAVCEAANYQELAQQIWKDRHDPNGWIRQRARSTIAIFEGDPAGTDREGWPLFTARRLVAIADVKAINPCPEATNPNPT